MTGWADDTFQSLALSMQHPAMLIATMAVAFVLVSAFLVQRALRLNRINAAARIALITPWTHAASVAPARAAETLEEVLRGTEQTSGEREISRRLTKFRIPGRFGPAFLLAARVWFALCLGIGFWFIVPYLTAAGPSFRALLAGAAGFLGWYLPALAANWAAKTRAATVVAGLPDALELLVICAEGGLALGDGIDRIVTGLRRSQPELAEELAMTAADLKILPSQDLALARLAARIDAPIVQSVVTTLTQSMRYGTPFAQAMRTVASEIRTEALIRLEERANKLPALLTVPMILFIMPTIFIAILGPAILKVMDSVAR